MTGRAVTGRSAAIHAKPTRMLMASALAAAALSVAGCAGEGPSLPKLGDMNPFKEKQVPLPGKRVAVMAAREKVAGELADASQPIALPPAQANDAWTQAGGLPSNAPGHLTLAGSRQVWSADAGAGSNKGGRVTAPPIVGGGHVYTLDAEGRVTAFSVSGGSAVWRASLAPSEVKPSNASFSLTGMFSLGGSDVGGAYGGGLAIDNGRLYGASGFGTVVALDPSNGKRLWEKNLGVPVRAAPTASGDRVFVIGSDGRFFCLSGADGAELWAVRGLPQSASLVMNVSAAVEGDIVVVPYPTGDLVALKTADGSAAWTESLARTRTTSQLASLSDAARPAIENGVVYAVGHAGRMIATQAKSGERLWSINVPGTQMPWVAGDTVFVVDTMGQLVAVSKRDGKVQWTVKLPGSGTWSGPVLASGSLWVASSKGALVAVEATTGKVAGQQDLGSPVFIAPVVAQGRMFVLTDNAKLIALN